MSEKPEKLSVRFLLNKEPEQSSHEERRNRRQSPASASSSSSPSPDSSVLLRKDASTRRTKRQSPDSSSVAVSSGLAPAGSSASHAARGSASSERIFRCELCGKNFVERGNLNKHISSVHRKEKTKVCPEPGCGKSFSFRDGLIRHVAHVHQNQRRHACRLCDKTFKQASHLGKHMRSIHKKP